MKHTIIGYQRHPKSTLYYLISDDSEKPTTCGKSCDCVFVPTSQHEPVDDDIGKTVELRLRKVDGAWRSSIKF